MKFTGNKNQINKICSYKPNFQVSEISEIKLVFDKAVLKKITIKGTYVSKVARIKNEQ